MKLEIEKTVCKLKQGKTILYPTDTIWGIGCDIFNKSAIDKIYKIKKREDSKTLIILVSDMDMLKDLVYINNTITSINQKDRATTVIYSKTKNIPDYLLAPDGSIAIRIPKDDFCIEIIKGLGNPIISTSANISDDKSPNNYSEINSTILQKVDYVVNLRQDDNNCNSASQIIKVNDDESISILRK